MLRCTKRTRDNRLKGGRVGGWGNRVVLGMTRAMVLGLGLLRDHDDGDVVSYLRESSLGEDAAKETVSGIEECRG